MKFWLDDFLVITYFQIAALQYKVYFIAPPVCQPLLPKYEQPQPPLTDDYRVNLCNLANLKIITFVSIDSQNTDCLKHCLLSKQT